MATTSWPPRLLFKSLQAQRLSDLERGRILGTRVASCVAEMLKISRTTNPEPAATPTLKLEGQIRGRWVEELRRACFELLAPDGARLALDLADVSFIDAAGLALFGELAARDVAVVNCSLFAAEQLKGVADGR